MKPNVRYKERFQQLFVYEADIELPRRVTLGELRDAERVCEAELRRGRPDMVVDAGPVHVEAIEGGYRLLLTVYGTTTQAPCDHLADSDQAGSGLSPEPCKLCGRYFADD